MKLKRFNEDITDDSVIPTGIPNPENDMFQTSIFADIEGDLEDMSPGEAEDYLSSIIVFCNQQIKGIIEEEVDEEEVDEEDERRYDDRENYGTDDESRYDDTVARNIRNYKYGNHPDEK
jgi:hypothetical protein